MNLISIVIPFYNAEKYIADCIISIQSQSYSDFEVIFVNDGSFDKSEEIVRGFMEHDERIKYFYQKKSGVGKARNYGIDNSSGEYIIFVDADDILPSNSLHIRINAIRNSQMAVCRYDKFTDNGVVTEINECDDVVWNQRKAVNNIAIDGNFGYQGYLWNKIYLKDIIDRFNIRFDENVAYNEDKLFNIEYVLNCDKINISNDIVYRYRENTCGAMNKISVCSDVDSEKILSEFISFDKMLGLIKDYDMQLYYKIALYAMRRTRIIMKQLPQNNVTFIRNNLKKMIRKYGLIAIRANLNTVNMKQKINVMGHVLMER